MTETHHSDFPAAAGKASAAMPGTTPAAATPYRSIDLFAGIGGIRMGFDQAFSEVFGTEPDTVFVSEFDKAAARTYAANHELPGKIHGDITAIPETAVPAFDICLAGFPCQAFSLAGRREGFADDYRGRARGTLFFDVARICAHHRPKVIFCENVKGLPIHDRGRTFETILATLREIGYTPFARVLNSKDFGTPQNRERIYIVAFRDDLAPDTFDFPQGEGSGATLRDILDDAPVPARYYLSERYLQTLREHRARHESAGHGFGYVIRDLDGIAGAVVCGGMGRERNLVVDPRPHSMVPTTNITGEINREDVRKLTPREWARLQGFPDTFALPGSDTQAYKQLGNTVTVPVIRAIAREVAETLKAAEAR